VPSQSEPKLTKFHPGTTVDVERKTVSGTGQYSIGGMLLCPSEMGLENSTAHISCLACKLKPPPVPSRLPISVPPTIFNMPRTLK
jgi:hypothetical protein